MTLVPVSPGAETTASSIRPSEAEANPEEMGCTYSSEPSAASNLPVESSETANVIVEELPELEPSPLPPKKPCPPPTCVFTYFKLGHNVKNWKQRYFVVDEGVLKYWESEEAFNAKKGFLGEITLQGYAATTCTVEGRTCISIGGEEGPSAVVFLANSPKKSLSTYIFGNAAGNAHECKNLVVEIPEDNERDHIATSIAEHISYKNYEVVDYPKMYSQYEADLAEYSKKMNSDGMNASGI